MATKQATIYTHNGAGVTRSLFISLGTARVWLDSALSATLPQTMVFVLQDGFVRANLTEVGAAAHSSLLIKSVALFQLASVSDTCVPAAPITHSFISSFPALPCQSLAACCLLK